ncbi:hypothetical protein NA57DRAFT_59999 [Rhizodiscina lignyota]|uniref:Uncharacterized protein n=1 Tax=Rhizodiscina lignyota TaxID=1504668 RepID=A0A9P4I7A1_9PEZI|nr:hypothetical protein NA57DRAFT_59999 [Rhizodiscina lignyota]
MDDFLVFTSSTGGFPLKYGFRQHLDEGAILSATLARVASNFPYLDDSSSVQYSGFAEPAVLIGNACNTDGGVNCTEICDNRTEIFRSWENQWNCLTLSALALSLLTFSVNSSTTAFIGDTVKQLGVDNITDFNAWGVLSATHDCAVASCRDQSMGNCSLGKLPSHLRISDDGSGSNIYDALHPVCSSIDGSVNVDLAGPGVLVSYIMQAAITLYGWALVHFFTLRESLEWILTPLRRWSCTIAPASTKRHLKSFLTRCEKSNQAHALRTLLAEFQEAQCCFITAVQIAVLYASSQSAVFYGADNWQSLVNDLSAVQMLAIAGAQSILLTQINLRRAKLSSVYSLVLATVASVLAYVVLERATNPNNDQAYRIFAGQHPIDECGGNPSLRTFCLKQESEFYSALHWMLPQAALLALLWGNKLWVETTGTTWYKKRLNKLSYTKQETIAWTERICSVVVTLYFAGEEIFTVYLLETSMLGSMISDTFALRSLPQWSIGQVIAVLVWAPVLSRYLYLVIRESPTRSQALSANCLTVNIFPRRYRARLLYPNIEAICSGEKK